MKRILLIALAGGLALAMVGAGTGCRRVALEPRDSAEPAGALRSDNDEIDLEGAERLATRIEMGVGQLRLSSAESSGVVTEFEYERPSWKPEVSYDVTGDTGHLKIEQPDVRGLRDLLRGGGFDADVDYTWDIGLPTGVPIDLQLDFGVGAAEVALGGLNLEDLRVNAGVGDMTIDLSGEWTRDLDANIEAGVGEVTLRVPNDVGVRVEGRHDGLGEYRADGMRVEGDAYVNEAYGKSPVTLDIALSRGVGDVTIELVD